MAFRRAVFYRGKWACMLLLSFTLVSSLQPTCAADIVSSGADLGAGDKVKLVVDIPGLKKVGDRQTEYFAPKGSVLWIDKRENDKLFVHFSCVSKPDAGSAVYCSNASDPQLAYAPKFARMAGEAPQVVDTHTEYTVSVDTFSTYAVASDGSQYGVLLVPYKFHLSDRSFSTGATIGGFYHFAFTTPGISWGPVASAGLGVVPVSSIDAAGKATTDNKAALSAATGFLVTFSKAGRFQIGLLAGWDWAGDEAHYKYEGKTWVALSFGMPLTK
jgi:hypothetical protein